MAGSPMKQILKGGVVYFAVVFAAGFVLGTVRTLWVVPRLGVRAAELAEMPIMLGISILATRWVVRHFQVSPPWSKRLAMGGIGLGLMLVAEFALGLLIRGMTIGSILQPVIPCREPLTS